MQVSEKRVAFWKDYYGHGIRCVMKKYSHASMSEKIKFRTERIFRGVTPKYIMQASQWEGDAA